MRLVRDGKEAFGHGLAGSLRYTIAPPGRVPLGSIRFSLVDVPDLRVLPKLWPGLRDIWMGARPVPEILHRMLNLCARLVRLKISRPVWLAPRGESYEYAESGRFHFHVEIVHRFTGLIVGYRGWLTPVRPGR